MSQESISRKEDDERATIQVLSLVDLKDTIIWSGGSGCTTGYSYPIKEKITE